MFTKAILERVQERAFLPVILPHINGRTRQNFPKQGGLCSLLPPYVYPPQVLLDDKKDVILHAR